MTRPKRRALSLVLLYAAATLALVVAVFPYAYLLLQSLAPWDQVERRWIPSELTLRSYVWLLQGGEASLPRPWLRAFLNSIVVSLADTATSLLCGMMVATPSPRSASAARESCTTSSCFTCSTRASCSWYPPS